MDRATTLQRRTLGAQKPAPQRGEIVSGEAAGAQMRLDIELGEGRDDHLAGGEALASEVRREYRALVRLASGGVPRGQVDGQALDEFETDLKGNLYKIWNRMSSGTYFPPPGAVLEVRLDHRS